MTPRRSQWRSASSITCVVTRIVVPACSRSACRCSQTIRAGGRVQADGRLVEEQHRGAVEQRGGDLQPAQHAAGERPREAVEHRRELHRLDRLLDPLASLASRHAGDAPVEVEVLIRRERAVDGDRLGDVADAGAHREASRADVEAGHERASLGRRQQRREHADHRRLAGPVRPEQAEHLAGGDREGDAADGFELAEADDEVVDQQRRRRIRGRSRAAARRRRSSGSVGRERAVGVGVQLADLASHALARLASARRWSLASSAARWRTSSSWRSMCPQRLPQQLAAALGATSSRRSLRAHLRAGLLGGEQRLQLLEGDARAALSGASPRAAARPRPGVYRRCRPEGRAGASGSRPISS